METTRLFSKETYRQRRRLLKRQVGAGVILMFGNHDSPRNYKGNPFYFRQDSSFLYYCGLDRAGLNLLLDIDADRDVLFADEDSPEELIWSGPRPCLADIAEAVGIDGVMPRDQLWDIIARALGADRPVQVLPPYRPEHLLFFQRVLKLSPARAETMGSLPLIRAVAAQRAVKTEAEISEIEAALTVTRRMHLKAMAMTRPGRYEYEVVGAMTETAYACGGLQPAYPIIFSVHGQILHPRGHFNQMTAGRLIVNDSGAESPLRYASDITRTLPVSGRFSQKQQEVYTLVLTVLENAVAAVRPGVRFIDIHLQAARQLAQGLKDLGILRGQPDTIVARGVHALFFPHGLGHMLGLDVHDMESLGEDHVGYGDGIERGAQFGLANLRLARELRPGFVLTVEPGIYFIPALIDQWRSEKKFTDIINYEALEAYRDFGGVRIEDNVLVTSGGCRVLGPEIPKTVAAVTEQMGRG